MDLDKKIDFLPNTKTNPKTLETLFGKSAIMPMWVADMDFAIAKPIQNALIARVTDSGFAYEYKPESFFKAQKNWYKNQYQIDLIKEQVLYSPTITTSISVIIENFTNKGDGIIIQPPVFMEFREVIRKVKRKVIKNALKLENNHYTIDFGDLEDKAKKENNKVLILCNPHNPVGRVWIKNELEKIVIICKKNDVILISDEIHKDIILFDNIFTSALLFTKKWDKIIVLTSEAKTFNLPGISDSMAIILNEEIRNSVKETFNRYNLGRTNALTRVAFETAYKEGKPWLGKLIKTIEQNVNLIENELSISSSKIRMIRPEGTYQVWLDFRSIFNDTKEMLSHVTKYSGIGMNAGRWFGREGGLFMRMNIATNTENVQNAIQKIIKAVEKRK